MKPLVSNSIYLLITSLFVVSCQQQSSAPCSYPKQVTIDSECYSGNGVTVTASDYGDPPLSFEWRIIALKDTTSNGWTPNDEKIRMMASNTFIIPDSLVANYQQFILTAAANCQGQLKYSRFYAFVKKTSASSNCITWAKKE